MIGETLIDMTLGLFGLLFSGLEFINLPLEFVSVLTNILAYGVWIVGLDIMALFVSSVLLWWGVHLSIGLAVWVWKLLPLT